MKIRSAAVYGLALAALAVSHPAAAGSAGKPTVVELFTSQSCYSCPPAEEYLGELAKRKDVLALEFHVDYWNDLVYGRAGRWRDVHSKAEFTHRQRLYAGNLPRGQVYTPQMVIDGIDFEVGSRRRAVRAAMKKVSGGGHRTLDVMVAADGAGIKVKVEGEGDKPSAIWLVTFTKQSETRVLRGENHGKILRGHNIVTDMKQIGMWQGKPVSVELPAVELSENQGCAILVQNRLAGPIHGAAYCPGIHG